MGAIFAVPLARVRGIGETPGVTVALDAAAELQLSELAERLESELDAPPGITVMIGAERAGLPEQVIAAADHVARIPIQTESLNAAMAATVALYELTRRMARSR
jgi:TrmH family RNA methyltransferase